MIDSCLIPMHPGAVSEGEAILKKFSDARGIPNENDSGIKCAVHSANHSYVDGSRQRLSQIALVVNYYRIRIKDAIFHGSAERMFAQFDPPYEKACAAGFQQGCEKAKR